MHGLLDAGLRLLPRSAAKSIEGRTCASRVFLDEIQPLDRHEELVVARVTKFEELLRRVPGPVDPELFEANELANPVIDMNDQVADFQLPEIGKECLG